MEKKQNKHVRFYRLEWIVGWEPLDDGLELYFRDGSRELIPMSAKDAEENSEFLCSEYPSLFTVRGISWETLSRGRGAQISPLPRPDNHAPSFGHENAKNHSGKFE